MTQDNDNLQGIDVDRLSIEQEGFDPYQTVVDFQDYAAMMASQEGRSKKAGRVEKTKASAAESEVSDSELAARLMRFVEFDEEKAIERARNKKWLIYGILPHADVGYIYGKPGSYKSFMAVDMACHVATATPWNGIDVDYPGAVLYIAGEGASELHIRKKAWRMATGQDNSAMTILERGVSINNVTERTELKAAIREIERITQRRHVLIVIDTFSKCFEGDENSSEDMRAFIAGCEDLRDSFNGCTVMFVGHTGKTDPNSMRGSSVALGDCGFSYRIRRGQQKLYAEMHCDKIKDATEPDDMAFNFEVQRTGDHSQKGIPLCSLVPKMTTLLEREDTEAEKEPGRAEFIPKKTVSDRNRSKLIGMLKSRISMNGGQPVNRMVIRDDMLVMFQQNEGMNLNSAKSAWKRAWEDASEAGVIVACEGDQWMLAKGV